MIGGKFTEYDIDCKIVGHILSYFGAVPNYFDEQYLYQMYFCEYVWTFPQPGTPSHELGYDLNRSSPILIS